MKQLFTKQLALLVMMFFTSLGSAFGYTITLQLNYENAADVHFFASGFDGTERTNLTFDVPDYLTELSFEVTPINSLYSVSSITVDDSDVTDTWRDVGSCPLSIGANHTVSVTLDKKPVQQIDVSINYDNVAVVNFNTSDFYKYIQESQTIEVPSGDDVWLSVGLPSSAYVIKSVFVDGDEVTSAFLEANRYFFEAISVSHTVQIELEKLQSKTITIVSQTSSVDPSIRFYDDDGFNAYANTQTPIELASGKNVKMQVERIPGYMVDRVAIVDEDFNTTNITDSYLANGYYEFAPLSDNYTAFFKFKEVATHTIWINYDESIANATLSGSWIDTENGNIVNEGSTERLKIDPYYGYAVASLTVDGEDMTSSYKENGYYDFTNVTGDHHVFVTFKDNPSFAISFNDEQGWVNLRNFGTITPEWTSFFAEGTVLALEVYPNDGYKVGSVTVNGTEINKENDCYEFTITDNCRVDVTFEKLPALTVNYDGSLGSVVISDYGSIASGYPFTYEEGTDVTLEVIPQVGYKVVSISVDGTPISMEDYKTNGYYKFTITDDCVVNVNIVQAVYYNVNVTYDDQQVNVGIGNNNYGVIWNPHESAPFMEGSEINLYFNPYAEGFVYTATVNGSSVNLTYMPEYNQYSCVITDDLDQNLDVVVGCSFAGITQVHASFNGSQTEEMLLNYYYVSPNEVRSFTKGSTVKVRLTPSIGYEVASVFLDNKQLTADSEGVYEFTVPQYDDCYLNVTTRKKTAPATVPFSLSDLGVATFCSEYDLDFLNMSSIKAYVASGYNPNTQELILTRVKEVPAGTGLLIKGAAGDYNIPTMTTSYMYANMLRGVAQPETLSRTSRYNLWAGDMEYANCLLGEDGNFHPINEGEAKTLPAYQAYLIIPCSAVNEGSLAKITTIFLDDEEEAGGIATGIGFLWADKSGGKTNAKADDVFNLQGQKVNSKTLKPGIYIRNGKKFMVK